MSETVITAEQHARDYVQGLRHLADFLELHPECIPYSSITLNLFPADFGPVLRAGYGKLEKRVKGDSWFTIVKSFGPAATIEWNKSRDEVCKRVKVGTKTVPAQPATPETTVDVFEWQCPPSLLNIDKSGEEGLQPIGELVS